MSYKFFQLPDSFEPQTTYLSFPDWIKDAIITKDIRVTADGEDVYVRTPVGEVRVEATDYIVRSSRGNIFVLSEELFENLAGIRASSEHAERDVFPPPPVDPSIVPNAPLPSQLQPQPSSGVLARSARARAAQAQAHPAPDNAHVEGADIPPTPDEPTPAPSPPTDP